jgi:preprotein translocase subunit SecG
MYSVLLTIHVLVTVFLIGIILMQRSASDGMGLSSSSSTSFLSGRAAASAVTRATAILATLFILTSLGLGILTARSHPGEISVMDRLGSKPAATLPLTPGTSLPAPAAPAKPSVPRPE